MRKNILFVLLLLFIPLVQAEVPVASYWGYVTVNSVPQPNAAITVIDSSGNTVASATGTSNATYTVLVPVISGQSLTFKVNGVRAATTIIGDKGASIRLDLAVSSSSGGGGGGGSGGGTYSPGYTTTGTGTAQATATAVQTAIATSTPVVENTEVPAATTAKPEVTTTKSTSTPTTPGFGAIIAVFAIAMIASLLKNNRFRR